MQIQKNLSVREEGNVKQAAEKSNARNSGNHASCQTSYQDFHIKYRTNADNPGNTHIIQCFSEESRTLRQEGKQIKEEVGRRTNDLEYQISDLGGSREVDDHVRALMAEQREISMLHQTLHHILPRNAIDKFIHQLSKEQKKSVLLKFIRYTGEDSDKDDVSKEEYERIMSGGDEALITKVLEKTLKSLRSNLTFGPEERSDDPAGKPYDLDPNFVQGGQLDEISECYKEAYDKIGELHACRDRQDGLVAEITEKFERAEGLLAVKQGLSGPDAYRHTRLEVGRLDNWVLNPDKGKPVKDRKIQKIQKLPRRRQ